MMESPAVRGLLVVLMSTGDRRSIRGRTRSWTRRWRHMNRRCLQTNSHVSTECVESPAVTFDGGADISVTGGFLLAGAATGEDTVPASTDMLAVDADVDGAFL